MRSVLILILAISTVAGARDKKAKAQPGPYVFASKASAQTLKALIFQQNLMGGYRLDSDNQFQFRFSKPAQMPTIDAIFTASNMCKGMTTKSVWSYTLVELNGATNVTVQPVWEYPDDFCEMQTKEFVWGKPEEIAAFQVMLEKAPTSNTRASTSATPTSPADQQQSMKQHEACVELAKNNPKITCK